MNPGEEDSKPEITWALVKRVLRYAIPFRGQIAASLLLILITSGLGLLTPLIFRDLIDYTLPAGDIARLNLLALALILMAAMIINMFVAAVAGTLIPLGLRALKVDPALASSVFITTLTDLFGFLSFLGLATIFVQYLQLP